MKKLLVVLIATIWSLSAQADYSQALAAFKGKNYADAEALLQEAANNGDDRAWNVLGVMYLQGLDVEQNTAKAVAYFERAAASGNVNAFKSLVQIFSQGSDSMPKDVERIRKWAWRFAQNNNAYAAFVYYQLAIQNELNVMDEQGRVDRQRYDALAKRPVGDRELDAKAYAMLSLAAERGYLPAVVEAQRVLLSRDGQAASEKALSYDFEIQDRYASRISAQDSAQLTEEAQALKRIQSLGSTRVSVALYNDVLPSVIQAADAQVKSCDRSKIQVAQLQVNGPIRGETYLPLNARLLGETLLLQGQWREVWTLNACGKKVAVPVTFEADGLAAAKFAVDAQGAVVSR